MQEPIKKFLNGGLDSDSAEYLVPPNCFISGQQFRFGSTDKGGSGYFESILKNAEKSHTLPAGTNLRIGFAADDENGFIVKANYNSNGNHAIYLFDIISELWHTVLRSADVTGDGLNFSKYALMNGMFIINGILYFNDNRNEPRKLHLGAFISGYGISPIPSPVDTDYVITYPVDESEITLIRKPSPYPPAILKLVDSGFSNNFIGNNSYQFAVEFGHFEGEQAVLSGWSKSTLLNKSTETYNYVKVSVDSTEEIPQTVRFVRIVVKRDIDEGFKGNVIKTWDRLVTADNTAINIQNLSFDFYGNVSGEQISDAKMVKPFDAVPLLTGSQVPAKNRNILVDNLEGYDAPATSSLILALDTPVALGFSTLNKQLWLVKHRNGRGGGESYAYVGWYVYLTEVFPVGFYLVNSLEALNILNGTYPAIPATPTTCAFSALTFRGADINAVILATIPSFSHRWDNDTVLTSSVCAITGITASTYGVFPPEALYKGGNVFYDRYLRKCSVVYNDELIEIPARNYAFSSAYSSIQWFLANSNAQTEIPDWAYYYCPVLTLNQRTRYFVASFSDTVRYATKNTTTGLLEFTATAFATNVVGIAININGLLQANLGWSVAEGDQCILIDNSNNKYELPVIGSQGDYVILKPQSIGSLTSAKFVYRLYIPYITSAQEPFYERGEMFEILNPGQSSRTYATIAGSFRPDAIALTRNYNSNTYFAEAMCPNDVYFQRWDTDAGRPNFITKLGQVRKPTGISFSNVYIQGTQTNGLSEFEAFNKEILPEDLGTLTKAVLAAKVQKDGSVLVVIGTQEVASIYLGEVEVFDANGSSYLAKSDKFIGTINVLKGGFGTSNHESVVEYAGKIAWYSLVQGAFVLYDNNGIFPISDRGLKRVANLFSQKYASLSVQEIEDLGSRPFVFGGIDPYHKELYWAIPATEETPPKGYLASYVSPDIPIVYPFDIYDGIAKVLVYKMQQDRWAAPHPYQTDGFIFIRDFLFSAKNGKLYKHNVDDGTANTYNQWYGTEVKSCFGVLVNEKSNIIKEFLTLVIEGNIQPTFCIARTELPNIQETDIVSEWRSIQNVFYVALRRDRLSPNTTGTYDQKLYKGDVMKGQWMKIWLEFETAELLQLRYLNVSYRTSEGQKT